MPLEQQMVSYPLTDQENIERVLQANWEPFSVSNGEVFFRRQHFNEDREPLSSTKHHNWAGDPGDESDAQD